MTGWKERLTSFDRLDPDDEVYRRAQHGPRGPEVAPGPSVGRRVAAGITAFAVFGAAAIFAWSAFKGTDDDQLGEPPPVVELGSEGTILWPERTLAELEQAQADADASRAQTRWRLNAPEVARKFANRVLGWPTETFELTVAEGQDDGVTVARLERPIAECPTPAPGESSPDICYPGIEELRLVQPLVEGEGGIWAVSSVSSPSLSVEAQVGQVIQNGASVGVAAEIPEGLKAIAGTGIGEFDSEPSCSGGKGTRLQSGASSVSVSVPSDRESGMGCGERTHGYIYVSSASWRLGPNADPLMGDSSRYVALTAVPISIAIPENSPGEGLTTYTDQLGWSVDLPIEWTITPIRSQDRVSYNGASFSPVPANSDPNAVTPGPIPLGSVEVVITHRAGGPAPDITSDDSTLPLDLDEIGCGDLERRLVCGGIVRGNGTDYSVEIRRGEDASPDAVEAASAIVRSLRFPALEPGDQSNGWLALGPADRYPEGKGRAVYAGGRLQVVYVMSGPGGTYVLDLEPETCGEGQNMTWDQQASQVWIQCPGYTGTGDVRYDRDGSPDPSNGPEFARALRSYPVITAWDGSLLVYEQGSMDGLAESLWP